MILLFFDMESIDLTIIIVNWNVKPILEICLDSIFTQTKGISYEVIVVDNASTNGSREFLKTIRKKYGNLKVILNKRNLGFARASNQALKMAKGTYILFLNPDTEILDNALFKSVEFMNKHKDVGILGVKLLDNNKKIQPSVRSFPTFASQALILLKLHHLLPRLPVLKRYFLYNFNYQKLQEVDQVMGAFLMTRKKIINEIGGFDEKFFLWFEEVDFCKRVKEKKWKIVYNPEISILHFGHQSFRQVIPFDKQKIYNKSVITYFKKHHPSKKIYLLYLLQYISLILVLIFQLFNFLGKKKIISKINA